MQQADQDEPGEGGGRHDDVALSRFGGEFRARPLEIAFLWERLGETLQHARTLMAASAVLNALFLLSDWRFFDTPQFLIAIPSRLLVIAASLVALALLRRRCDTPGGVTRIMNGWMAAAAIGVAGLVTSHSAIALFVVVMLPLIFYLVVPTEFRFTVAGGVGCSVLLYLGYGEYRAALHTGFGLALAMAVLNVALAMAVTRQNRLLRLQWLTARSERRIAGELAQSREMLEKLFAASPVPMIVTSGTSESVLDVNQSTLELLGDARENIIGRNLSRFFVETNEYDRVRGLVQASRRVAEFEAEVRTASGAPRFVMVKTAGIDTVEGRINISGVIDISDRKATERSLEWLASTDGLTGLPNRMSFFAAARAEMMRAVRARRPLTLLMIDIDHFKTINDTFGHLAGDQALRAFAGLCLTTLRDQDVIGRLGGEEFGILLPGAGIEEAQVIAETLRGGVEAMRLPGEHEAMRITVSLGVSAVRPHERDLDHALARADMALYAAKRSGRNRIACDGEAIAEILPDRRRGGGGVVAP